MELGKVPCLHNMTALYVERGKFRALLYTPAFRDPKLEKRMVWIMKCGNFHGGTLIGAHNLRDRVSRYFFRINSILKPVRMPYGWIEVPTPMTKDKCYFLGTWPWFYNTKTHSVVYAHDLKTGQTRTQGSKPEMPGQTFTDEDRKAMDSVIDGFDATTWDNYYYPERLSGDYRTKKAEELNLLKGLIDKATDPFKFSFGNDNVENYIKSKRQLDALMKRFKNCIKLKYPPQEKKTSKLPPKEKPMNELALPEVDHEPTPPPPETPGGAPAQEVQRLTLTFGIKLKSLQYTWTLSTTMAAYR